MTQRLFTPDEVDALIPQLAEIVGRAMEHHERATALGRHLHEEQARIQASGGGLIDQRDWKAKAERLDGLAIEIREALAEITAMGGVTKDLETGLVDFPGRVGGEIVNLCWKHGETAVRFWHGFDEGYAQREAAAASYRAVLFDLFDTLVTLDRDRLPEITVNGKVMRSTAGVLYEAFKPYAPGIALERFVDTLRWSWQEAERLRNEDHREVAASERLTMAFRRMDLDPAELGPEPLEALLGAHMRELSNAVVFPTHHGPLLRALRARYRLALVSNFDYSPTALGVLERAGITDLFDTILVSDEVGWRKPKPMIFELAVGRLGIDAGDGLFVGDRIDIDVAGAQGVGMGSAWVNPERVPLPPDVPAPDYEIRDLAELGPILGIS